MIRIRKNNEQSSDLERHGNTTTNKVSDNSGKRAETSFFYKESSLSSKDSSANNSNGHQGQNGLQNHSKSKFIPKLYNFNREATLKFSTKGVVVWPPKEPSK